MKKSDDSTQQAEMNRPDDGIDSKETAETIRKIRRLLELIRKALEHNEERADSLLQYINDLEKIASLKYSGLPPFRPTGLIRSSRFDDTSLLKLVAKNGVAELTFEWLETGKAQVRIDGGKALPLPQSLACLLDVLASDSRNDQGQFVDWKTYEQVAKQLKQRLGREFVRHTIDGLVSRLRSKLTKGGVNRFLIQTDKKRGIRFAVRRNIRCDG